MVVVVVVESELPSWCRLWEIADRLAFVMKLSRLLWLRSLVTEEATVVAAAVVAFLSSR